MFEFIATMGARLAAFLPRATQVAATTTEGATAVAKGGFSLGGFLNGAKNLLTTGTLAGGLLVGADATLNGGRFSKPILSNLIETYGMAQQDGGKDTGRFGFGKLIDVIGEVLTVAFGRNTMTDGIRDFGQRIMGVKPEDRIFGTPDNFVKGKDTISPATSDTPAAPGTTPPTAGATPEAPNIMSDFAAAGAAGAGFAIGIRSIPVLGGIYAGATGIYDSASYALKGEWEKAGTRLVSGAVDAAISTTGPLGLLFAPAAREIVEETAQKFLGDKADLPDNAVVGLAYNIVDAVRGKPSDPALV